MKHSILLAILALTFFAGCQYEDHYVGSDVDVPRPVPIETLEEETCGGGTSFIREAQFNSIFVDPEFNTFEMTIDIEAYGEYPLSALDVGRLAYFLVDEHKKMGYPNNDKVREILSNGHFIVVRTPEIFDHLRGEEGAWEKIGAYIWVQWPVCWETPEGVNWSSVVSEHNYSLINPRTVIHEMIHAVAYATYGDSEGKHGSPLFWSSEEVLVRESEEGPSIPVEDWEDRVGGEVLEDSLLTRVADRHDEYLQRTFGYIFN